MPLGSVEEKVEPEETDGDVRKHANESHRGDGGEQLLPSPQTTAEKPEGGGDDRPLQHSKKYGVPKSTIVGEGGHAGYNERLPRNARSAAANVGAMFIAGREQRASSPRGQLRLLRSCAFGTSRPTRLGALSCR